MADNLELVRAAGIPFGFIFTLTQYNLDELEWVAAFALEQPPPCFRSIRSNSSGALLAPSLRGAAPDGREAGHAYVEVRRQGS